MGGYTVLDATEQRVLYEYVVDYGTELTLYPYPVNDAPWRFTGWLGDDASLVVDGVVEMTDDVALGQGSRRSGRWFWTTRHQTSGRKLQEEGCRFRWRGL